MALSASIKALTAVKRAYSAIDLNRRDGERRSLRRILRLNGGHGGFIVALTTSIIPKLVFPEVSSCPAALEEPATLLPAKAEPLCTTTNGLPTRVASQGNLDTFCRK